MEDDPFAGLEQMDEEEEVIDLNTTAAIQAKAEEAMEEEDEEDNPGSDSEEDMPKNDKAYVDSDEDGEDEVEVSEGSASGGKTHRIVPQKRNRMTSRTASSPQKKTATAKSAPVKKKKKPVDPEEVERLRLARRRRSWRPKWPRQY